MTITHPTKIDLNKEWLPKKKTFQNFDIDAQGFRKTRNENPPTPSADRSALDWQVGRHGLAGKSYLPRGRIFIFCFSEPLGINIKILNGLLLW